MQGRHVLLHRDRDAAERIDGIVDAVQVGDEHDDVAGRDAAIQDHPAAVTQHEGLAEVAQGALQEQVAAAEPCAIQIIAVSGLGNGLEAVSLARLGARQLDGFDGREGVGNPHRDVFPHHVILGNTGFQAARGVPRNEEIKRQGDQRGDGEPPALGQHDGADSDHAQHFRSDLARHGRNDGCDLVGLIDAPGESSAGSPVKEGEGQVQDVPEGGLDQVGLDGAGDGRTLEVGGQGEEVAGHADDEQQGDGPQQGSQCLLAGTGRDVIGAMRELGSREALRSLLLNSGRLRLGGGDGRAGFFHHAVHEQAGDVVDGGAVDERLQKIGAGPHQGQEGDENESLPVRPRQLKENLPRTEIVRGASVSHGHRSIVAV